MNPYIYGLAIGYAVLSITAVGAFKETWDAKPKKLFFFYSTILLCAILVLYFFYLVIYKKI